MNAIVSPDTLSNPSFDQLDTRFDVAYRTLWTYLNPTPRPTFNKVLLNSMIHCERLIQSNGGKWFHGDEQEKIDYVVFASHSDNAFNYGGDLNHFAQCIRARDKATLKEYASLCIDVIHRRIEHFDSDITTIALVEGNALGGGFESLLCADIIIAERGVEFGFPECLFNLFPGMGALSLLSRKVGINKAKEMVSSAKRFTAEELHALGVVDVLAEPGTGQQAVYTWVRKNHKRRNSFNAIQRAVAVDHPVTFETLTKITDIWVDAALALEERDLKMMDKLVRLQNEKVGSEDANDALAA